MSSRRASLQLGAGEERWLAVHPSPPHPHTSPEVALGNKGLTPWRPCCSLVPGSAPDTLQLGPQAQSPLPAVSSTVTFHKKLTRVLTSIQSSELLKNSQFNEAHFLQSTTYCLCILKEGNIMTTEKKSGKVSMCLLERRSESFLSVVRSPGNSFCFPSPLPVIRKAEDYIRMEPHPPTALGEIHRALLAPGAVGALHCLLCIQSVTTHSSLVCGLKEL